MRRINHTIAFSYDGARINQAEHRFARLRRAGWDGHHHSSGRHPGACARELAWPEDTRRRADVEGGYRQRRPRGLAQGEKARGRGRRPPSKRPAAAGGSRIGGALTDTQIAGCNLPLPTCTGPATRWALHRKSSGL